MEQCLGQLARTGRLVLVGAGIKPPRFDPNRILLNELVITGAFCYDADGFERALELLAAPGFPKDVLIEPDDVGLHELLGAIEQLGAGQIPAKVVVAPARGKERGVTDTKVRPPRFNHVAMSVPSELLEPAGRAELTAFYADVFGWQELPTETVDGQKLVFGVHTVEQFVFLIADDPPMTCPRLDHYGLSVQTEAELDAVLAKAQRLAGA